MQVERIIELFPYREERVNVAIYFYNRIIDHGAGLTLFCAGADAIDEFRMCRGIYGHAHFCPWERADAGCCTALGTSQVSSHMCPMSETARVRLAQNIATKYTLYYFQGV